MAQARPRSSPQKKASPIPKKRPRAAGKALARPTAANSTPRDVEERDAMKRLRLLRKVVGSATLPDLVAVAERLLRALDRLPTADDHLIVLAIDQRTKSRRLAQSAAKEVRGWIGTDADLVREAAEKSHYSETAFVQSAVLSAAKAAIAAAARGAKAQNMPAEQRRGRMGSNEPRLIEAYNAFVAAGERITFYALARRAGLSGAYLQAKRFMERRGLSEGIATEPLPTPTNAPADAGR
jgi:hypothetical protein